MLKKSYTDKIICFDFDGTLTERDISPAIGQLDFDMIALLERLYDSGYYIIINSARQTIDYEDIKNLLEKNRVRYNQLSLGIKPVADLYIDDKGLYGNCAFLESYIEFYFSGNLNRYLSKLATNELHSPFAENIANVPENPDYREQRDSNFRVYLPISGGMDSATMKNMLDEAGTLYRSFYFDFGQEYAKEEMQVLRKVLNIDFQRLDFTSLFFKNFKHIMVGRNAFIIFMLAKIMRSRGEWGEIWFGNLQGESPVLGGDKSRRFFNDIQKILYSENYDIRVINPLLGVNKVDEVAYWKYRDINLLRSTKSCFSGKVLQCGKCQACFRKYVAFMANDIDISKDFDREPDFDIYIEKYKKVMNDALKDEDYSHYSPARIQSTLFVINKIKKS